jgi:hypothetical protein
VGSFSSWKRDGNKVVRGYVCLRAQRHGVWNQDKLRVGWLDRKKGLGEEG